VPGTSGAICLCGFQIPAVGSGIIYKPHKAEPRTGNCSRTMTLSVFSAPTTPAKRTGASRCRRGRTDTRLFFVHPNGHPRNPTPSANASAASPNAPAHHPSPTQIGPTNAQVVDLARLR